LSLIRRDWQKRHGRKPWKDFFKLGSTIGAKNLGTKKGENKFSRTTRKSILEEASQVKRLLIEYD
jgi:hypothetical protein